VHIISWVGLLAGVFMLWGSVEDPSDSLTMSEIGINAARGGLLAGVSGLVLFFRERRRRRGAQK